MHGPYGSRVNVQRTHRVASTGHRQLTVFVRIIVSVRKSLFVSLSFSLGGNPPNAIASGEIFVNTSGIPSCVCFF